MGITAATLQNSNLEYFALMVAFIESPILRAICLSKTGQHKYFTKYCTQYLERAPSPQFTQMTNPFKEVELDQLKPYLVLAQSPHN